MYNKRLLTGCLLGPAVFAIIWWGGSQVFSFFFLVVTAICLYEFFSMAFPGRFAFQACFTVLGLLPPAVSSLDPDGGRLLLVFWSVFLVSAFFFVVTYRSWENALDAWSRALFGIFYLGLATVHVALLRGLPSGREYLLFLLIVIFAGDIGAYYMGRATGRHKLSPHVSPKKTIEGSVGGLAASFVAASALWFLWFRGSDPRIIGLVSLLLGAIGQLGDLAESVMKRSVSVKDSGRILPGHGGMLDRLDAVLMAAPAMYWIVLIMQEHGFGIR